MRRHPKRIHVDPSNPVSWGTSDMNGMIGPHNKMAFQWDWRGNDLVNLRFLVHPDEIDKPNRQLGNIVLSPDPPPKKYSRPENYDIDEASLITTEDGQSLLTENGTAILDAPVTE